VFYVLSHEKRRPIHKKADLMKAINLNGKSRSDQDEVLDRAMIDLEDIFGFKMMPMEEIAVADGVDDGAKGNLKNSYILMNTLAHKVNEATGAYISTGSSVKPNEGDVVVAETDIERAKTSLLYSLLSAIFMSHSFRLLEDQLNAFLIKMGLMADFNREDGGGYGGHNAADMEAKLRKTFGVADITALIKEEFGRKQQYIDVKENNDGGEDGVKTHEYRWGLRAKLEVRKAEILKSVAAMYDCKPSDFKAQYESIKESGDLDDLEADGGDAGDQEMEQAK